MNPVRQPTPSKDSDPTGKRWAARTGMSWCWGRALTTWHATWYMVHVPTFACSIGAPRYGTKTDGFGFGSKDSAGDGYVEVAATK